MDDFSLEQSQLRELVSDVLTRGLRAGASSMAVQASESYGLSVTARLGKMENTEYNRDKGLGITVYLGQAKGDASTSDFSPAGLQYAIEAALAIARHTAVDSYAGLAEPEDLARDWSDPKLYYPWHLESAEAVKMACEMEASAMELSPLIRNSDGASIATQHSQFAYASSNGFLGGYASSRHYLSCSVIASPTSKGKDQMEQGGWYVSRRDHRELPGLSDVGKYAGRRALSRLGAKKLSTRECRVLYEAPLAIGLIGSLVSATSGSALYKKTTFLVDAKGKQIFPSYITIQEDPNLPKGLASSPFDGEGVATRARTLVNKGVLQGYFLSSYSARKLGLSTTGNAGGCHNLRLMPTVSDNFEQMLQRLGTGLLLTDLMGFGVNYVTGDYSHGASGYWVEKGKIVYPVHEITVASNLPDMFMGIEAVGGDEITRGSMTTGSVLIQNMMLAGM